MKTTVFCAVLIWAVATSMASAQDAGQIAGVAASAAQSLGQAMASAAANSSNVFVTATGHASLPMQAQDVYTLTIQGRAKSAVDAARQYDDHIKAAQTLGSKFHIGVNVGTSSFSSQIDPAARIQRAAQARAQASGGLALDLPTGPNELQTVFAVSSPVQFTASSPAQFAAFLDAMKSAGALDSDGWGAIGLMSSANNFSLLGLGSAGEADDAVWNQALGAAVATARRQAQAVAIAAGRQLGEVKQVSILARSVRGQEASVTVAVSYAFSGAK